MRFVKRIVGVGLLLLFGVSPLLVLWQRQNIYDYLQLRKYIPSSSIVALADQTYMTPLGRKIFYVQRPELQNLETFQQSCTTNEQTIVLGCYKSRVGIYVYDVTDSRLNGIQQVTAAHEMLHAAYDRLSASEKARINNLTSRAYEKLTDKRIKKNIEAYRSKDPAVVPNELHSILASEVSELSTELEQYYQRYFTDRQKVVAYSNQYEAEFANREQAIATYDEQLKALKTTIDGLNASLDSQGKSIDAKSDRLKKLLAAGEVTTYNAGIPEYQRLVSTYNSELAKLRSSIGEYNDIVERRNGIVGEERQLFQAIDTRVPSAR